MSSESAVLNKLDAAELRIGMCDDAKLSALLDPALINLLGFVASPHAPVKTKVRLATPAAPGATAARRRRPLPR